MEADKLLSLVIGGIAVAGGLAVGAISIIVSVPWSMKEKLAKLEARTKERLALIEKGFSPEQVFKEPKGAGQDPLLWGLLLAGMGFGIFLGYILYLITGWDRVALINSMAILFGGGGLIVYRLFFKRPDDQHPA
jgi:hypothetical protein